MVREYRARGHVGKCTSSCKCHTLWAYFNTQPECSCWHALVDCRNNHLFTAMECAIYNDTLLSVLSTTMILYGLNAGAFLRDKNRRFKVAELSVIP